jgi:hypothetical protein
MMIMRVAEPHPPPPLRARCVALRIADVGGVCFEQSSYSDSVTQANSRGARMCTANELIFACGRGSGCNFDAEMIWSSTLDPMCAGSGACGAPTAPTRQPTNTQPPTQLPTNFPSNFPTPLPTMYPTTTAPTGYPTFGAVVYPPTTGAPVIVEIISQGELHSSGGSGGDVVAMWWYAVVAVVVVEVVPGVVVMVVCVCASDVVVNVSTRANTHPVPTSACAHQPNVICRQQQQLFVRVEHDSHHCDSDCSRRHHCGGRLRCS